MNYRLPDFLIGGAMKAGTTALFSALKQNPAFNMSTIKEPNFFSSPEPFLGNWNMGFSWYERLFRNIDGLRGEASTAYTKYPRDPRVLDRIYSFAPNIKFIYMIRNPLDRSISHYLHNKLRSTETRNMEKALLDLNGIYGPPSHYFLQLSRLYEVFPAKNIHVIVSERMWTQFDIEIKNLYRFLGAPTQLIYRPHADRLHRTVNKLSLSPAASQLKIRKADLHTRAGCNPVKGVGAKELAGHFGMTNSLRQTLRLLVREQVTALREMLGDPIHEWTEDFPITSATNSSF